MKSLIHDVVQRLLELHSWEERLSVFQRSREKGADALTHVESLRAKLPVTVLAAHDQMRSRGKRSVAEVRRGVCCGCHLALGLGNVADLLRGEMRRCGNCGRYVYVVDHGKISKTLPTKSKKRSGPRREPALTCLAS